LIPRIIWIMWWQGIDEAPDLVKQCYASWKKYNSNWKIIFLDENNLAEYLNLRDIIDINRQDITIQKIANLVRMNLLARYGGVWADSTCFCCRPLDDWIDGYSSSGFFAFEPSAKDRVMSNWFLASDKKCYLTKRFCEEHNLFWKNNQFLNRENKAGRFMVKKLKKILNQDASRTRWWFSFFVLKVLRVYPYHVFPYLFAELIKNDIQCRKIWEETKKISVDIPNKLQIEGMLKPLSEKIKREIDNREAPFYKLTWKYIRKNKDVPLEGTVLGYLLYSK